MAEASEVVMDGAGTPRGIGVDAVTISEIGRLDREADGFTARTFTARERAGAAERGAGRASYLAGRFAAKEAVFKALAHLTEAGTFDLRLVETLAADDGSPHVQMTPELARICEQAGVRHILVSISNEADLAIAFAVVV